jgi:hypothetical protein
VKPRSLLQSSLEGIGAALLLLLPFIWPFLLRTNLVIYFHRLPVANLVGGLLIDWIGFSIVAAAALLAVQRLPPISRRICNMAFAGLVLWRALDVLNESVFPVAHWSRVREPGYIAIALLGVGVGYALPRVSLRIERTVRLLLAAFAFSAVWIVPHLLQLALTRQAAESIAFNHPTSLLQSASHRRVLWILLDELSYDQIADHPSPGLRFPNLDQLRAQSVSFSDLSPIGFYTETIIPSLLAGRRIDKIRSTLDGALSYRDESQNRWVAYDPNATLFAVARQSGLTTGVSGWFIPYCRLFAPVLSSCSWVPTAGSIEVLGASTEKSAWANAAVLPKALLGTLTRGTGFIKAAEADRIVMDYRDTMQGAEALIADNRIQFAYLHIPVPHPPGIYDRKNHTLRAGGTYLDNLMLADDTLGTLMQKIEATPSADQTTIIVSSDHSWRIPLWRHSRSWSEEEERASQGRFDDRPVLLIHFPHQQSGSNVGTALTELLEHDIIAGMVRGQINDQNDLAAFLAEHGR